MKNDHKRVAAYWDGIPKDLRKICKAAFWESRQTYCSDAAIKWLTDHVFLDPSDLRIAPLVVARWIDVTFEHCMFPLDPHEESWWGNSDEIKKILDRSRDILKKYAPKSDPSKLNIALYGDNATCTELSQKLNVYYCALYALTEEEDLLECFIKKVLDDTKQNIRRLITRRDAEKLAIKDDWTDRHYAGIDNIEIITWLTREYIGDLGACIQIAKAYEEYALFLEGLKTDYSNSRACHILHMNAERRLTAYAGMLLEHAEDCLEDAQDWEQPFFTKVKVESERIIEESNARIRHAERIAPENIGSANAYSQIYHDKLGAFSKKLKLLMDTYPTLPVVVSSEYVKDDDNTDCKIADVLDPDTHEFRERIILIGNKRDTIEEIDARF